MKKARDTVKETKSRLAEAHGVVESTKQAYFACKGKGKSQDKVKRETREETISGIEDVQGQWLRGDIPDTAEFRRRVKGKCKGCSGGRAAQEKSKGTKSWQKENQAPALRGRCTIERAQGGASGRKPSHHISSARARARVALMDGYGHGFIYEHRLGLILVHNLG